MQGKPLLIGGALVLIAVSGTLYWRLQSEPQGMVLTSQADSPADIFAGDSPVTSIPTEAQLQALLQNPAVKNQEQRLAFHQAYRSFVSGAAELSPAQRESQAQALREQIETYEQRSELAMSESLLLQLGLIQLTTYDEQAQKDQATALVARYKAISAEREAKSATPSAEFQRYKVDEKRIVEEVLSMDSIPDGLSRDEYLRQRLQQAREQHYQ
ncbi:hypothetical protein [Pseudomonas anguilliseptica]|uniref:hypothetical protein n=1 Tax=Pseudomonas anguilliseptica TaxID=53406 RepID=UPI001F3723C4|nr:hypothetical protein [Pseudomonas anguilliseptica]MCE5363547.1 hypothetical protein [Pseudomonas anguilliseptica]